MLKIQKLHKSYPIGDSSLHVLKGIDLFVDKGEKINWRRETEDRRRYSIDGRSLQSSQQSERKA